MKGSKILCETALGYKMDDLLTSYTYAMVENIQKARTVKAAKKRDIQDVQEMQFQIKYCSSTRVILIYQSISVSSQTQFFEIVSSKNVGKSSFG